MLSDDGGYRLLPLSSLCSTVVIFLVSSSLFSFLVSFSSTLLMSLPPASPFYLSFLHFAHHFRFRKIVVLFLNINRNKLGTQMYSTTGMLNNIVSIRSRCNRLTFLMLHLSDAKSNAFLHSFNSRFSMPSNFLPLKNVALVLFFFCESRNSISLPRKWSTPSSLDYDCFRQVRIAVVVFFATVLHKTS